MDGKISTERFVKSAISPAIHHLFLHYTSFHPEHTKRFTVFSQALRISRICSCESDFLRHLGNMKSWFLERRYSSDLVESETEKVKFTPNVNNKNIGKSVKGIPFVLTYHPKESHWIRFSLKLCTFYIWTKKWKSFLHQNPWFYSAVPES